MAQPDDTIFLAADISDVPLQRSPSIRTEPLFPAAVLLISGIICGHLLPGLPARLLLIIGFVCLVLCAIAGLWSAVRHESVSSHRRLTPTASVLGQIFLAISILITGAILENTQQSALNSYDIARALPPHGRILAALRLEVISAPKCPPPPARGALFRLASPVTTFCGKVLASRANGKWHSATGRVQVRAAGQFPALATNQVVEIEGWLSRPPQAENPGGFDDRAYLARQRMFAVLSTAHASQLRLTSPTQRFWPLTGWLDAYRQHLRHLILASQPKGSESGHALVALLLGYRDRSVRSVARAFSMAGAAHLLALSGMHVVIIAGAIWFLLRLLIRRPRRRATITLLVVLMYMLLTPCGPPVVRAALGTVLVLISMLRSRPPRILNILAITAIVVVIWSPMEVFEAPFQLSFLTTLGLIGLAPRVYRGLFGGYLRRQAELARGTATISAAIRLHVLTFFLGAFTANLIGSLIAFPLVALHYHQINPLAVINGLLLLPLVTLVLVFGMVELLAGLIFPPLAHFLAILGDPSVRVLAWLVKHLAHLPGSNIAVRSPPGLLVWLFFILLIIWIFRRRFRLCRADIAVLFTAWLVLLVGWYAWSQPHRAMRILALSAGSGNALLAETPGGRVIVLAAGTLGSPSRLTGEINTALRLRGLSSITAVIAPQIDSAHAAALPNILARNRIAQAFTDRPDMTSYRNASGTAGVIELVQKSGRTLRPLSAGDTLKTADGCTIDILFPTRKVPPRKLRGLVLLISFHGQHVLIISRAQGHGAVLEHLHIRKHICAVILTGSGNLNAGTAYWLRTLAPQLVITCGENRRAIRHDRHLLRQTGIRFLQTGKCGAVDIAMTDNGLRVPPCR